MCRLERLALHGECSCITAEVLGETMIYKLGVPGEHHGAQQPCGARRGQARRRRSGARGAGAWRRRAPAKGRGVRSRLSRRAATFTLIDESYNANPASMRAALALLAQARTRQGRAADRRSGRHAGTGRAAADALMRELAEAVDEAAVDVLYACGPLMAHLWEKTPPSRRGAYADTSDRSERSAARRPCGAGDVVMIKGSLGSRMGPLVEAHAGRAFRRRDKDMLRCSITC